MIRAEKKVVRTTPARVVVILMNWVIVRLGVIHGVEGLVFELFYVCKGEKKGEEDGGS